MPSPVLASFIKLSNPHPKSLVQKNNVTKAPNGSILLLTIKSSKSIITVPSPNGAIKDKTLKPNVVGRLNINNNINSITEVFFSCNFESVHNKRIYIF